MKLANFSNNTVLWQQTCGKESEGIFPITVGDLTPVFMSVESNGSCTTCTTLPLLKEFPNFEIAQILVQRYVSSQ